MDGENERMERGKRRWDKEGASFRGTRQTVSLHRSTIRLHIYFKKYTRRATFFAPRFFFHRAGKKLESVVESKSFPFINLKTRMVYVVSLAKIFSRIKHTILLNVSKKNLFILFKISLKFKKFIQDIFKTLPFLVIPRTIPTNSPNRQTGHTSPPPPTKNPPLID